MADSILVVQSTEMSQEQQMLLKIIGIDKYLEVCRSFGGTSLYIPKPDAFDRAVRDEHIRKEFNGYNVKELAIKYGLTDTRIRSIVSDIATKIKRQPIDGQVGFDDLKSAI